MLYVFHVNTGRMITLDMSSALDTVHTLKETIERICGIPKTHQVLLISGGEILQYGTKVFSYSSGTDTNPIFMFSTHNLQEIPVTTNFKDECNFKEVIRLSQKLPATYSTVVSRAQIAHRMFEVADEETKKYDRMVYEQHLQQQGWSAVVANMEDVTKEFKQRFIEFFKCLDEHLSRRPEYMANLASFDNDLSVLDKIPISPGLVSTAHQSFSGFGELLGQHDSFPSSLQDLRTDETANGGDGQQSSSADGKLEAGQAASTGSASSAGANSLTLLQWLTGKDAKSSLQDVAVNCCKTIDIFNQNSIQQLKNAVDFVLNQSRQEGMREIIGVAPRFQGLDKLMCSANKLVREQSKIATAFQQNQNRASDLGDSSILPDLCESHLSQLDVMLMNHTKITDIHRRVRLSKEELCNNLVQRIRYLVNMENRMSELDSRMLFYNRSLRRVQRHLAVIEQIHDAPSMYVQAISEVIRRKTFSTCFVKWSANLVANWTGIYNEEINRRQDFSSKFEGHFLNGLFTGLDDMPPDYAIQEPHSFDTNLPNVTMNDMTNLTTIIPEVTSEVVLPDLTTVTRFFLSHTNRIVKELQTTSEQASSLEPQPRPTDVLHHLKDPCDSETDTEEFEKVDKVAAVACTEKIAMITSDASTSTEHIEMVNTETLTDQSGSAQSDELERMRGLLRQMSQLCSESFGMLRDRLRHLKEDSTHDRQHLEQHFTTISATVDKINNETRTEATNQINRITHNHAATTAALQSQMLGYVKTIEGLCSQMVDQRMINSNLELEHSEQRAVLEKALAELKERLAELDQKLTAAEADKQQAVDEARDTMTRSHKTEIESLRSRFKLMTNMERSPSDTSLEKIDRAECSEAPQFDIEHVQTTQPRAATKMMLAHSPMSPSKSSSDLYRQILFTKDQELDALRQQQRDLEAQNKLLTERLAAAQTVQPVVAPAVSAELETVREELVRERSRRRDVEESMLLSKSRVDVSSSVIISSPTPSSATGTRSRGINCRRMVCIDACTKGDNVLVMWNPKHNQYTLFQDNPILYFLHAESHVALNLELPYTSGATSNTASNAVPPPEAATDALPPPPVPPGTSTVSAHPVRCVIGKVVEKEFCYARKDENRYKVERGTKFYRVKVAPRTNTCSDPASKCCSRRLRQDSDPTSLTVTPLGMSASTMTPPRPLSFVSSFAQTENDSSASPLSGADMVDLGVMPLAPTEMTEDVFVSIPTVADDDCALSDAPSLYHHAFDEVYETDEGNEVTRTDESKPTIDASRSSSSASETAPMATQIDHSIPYSDCH